jgi:hypothetical protein
MYPLTLPPLVHPPAGIAMGEEAADPPQPPRLAVDELHDDLGKSEGPARRCRDHLAPRPEPPEASPWQRMRPAFPVEPEVSD